MRILVTFAVEAEFAPWRKKNHFAMVQLADLTTYRTSIAGATIVVLLTGIGRKHAGSSTLGIQMVAADTDQYFDVCVSTGLAGALKPDLKAGEIVVASRLRTGTARAGSGKNAISCDEELVSISRNCGAREVAGFYEEDRILITAAEKAKLSSSADVVDMESFDVISESMVWGSRGVAVRAISDASESDLPLDLNLAVTRAGKISLSRLLWQALRQPARIPRLIRFGIQSRKAAESLAVFLDKFIHEIIVRGEAFSTRKRETVQVT
jgi:adenosylhomocysteine nucleosidase